MTTIRRPLIAGNWKMNGLIEDGLARAQELTDLLPDAKNLSFDLLICPPSTLLEPISRIIRNSGIYLGGQNCHPNPSGAHTGDISAEMLADVGCSYVILGHSERRLEQNEGNKLISSKAAAVLRTNLTAIICVGEISKERDAGAENDVIVEQLVGSLPSHVSSTKLVIAYEPVWAIGTGLTPKVDEIQKIHSLIRSKLGEILSPTDANQIRIIYGGSVSPNNAKDMLRLSDVDGALVGGASLNSQDFWSIAESAET